MTHPPSTHAPVLVSLLQEMQDMERAHAARVRQLERQNDQLELERAEERGLAKREVQRLAGTPRRLSHT